MMLITFTMLGCLGYGIAFMVAYMDTSNELGIAKSQTEEARRLAEHALLYADDKTITRPTLPWGDER